MQCLIVLISVCLAFLMQSDEVCHVLGGVPVTGAANSSVFDPFGLAVDSKGRLVMTSLATHTIARYDPNVQSNDVSDKVRLF